MVKKLKYETYLVDRNVLNQTTKPAKFDSNDNIFAILQLALFSFITEVTLTYYQLS